jgi:probable HAF family extracellular repeat protein
MKSRKLICLAPTLLVAVILPARLAAQEHADNPKHHHYQLIDLGTFGGPNSSTQDELQVLNSRGMIAGSADTSVPNHPNACGFCSSQFISHAFEWRTGVLHDLGALPGANSSGANWIADGGLSAGFSETVDTDPLVGSREAHAVLWKNGEITDLGTLEGGYESVAFAVNSRGQVAGAAFNTVPDPFSFLGTQQRVFLWEDGVMEDLGTLGGPDAGLLSGPLVNKGNVEMNEQGQVVACSFINSTPNPGTGVPTVDPFLWDKRKGMLDLGNLGGTNGCAINLNNRGQVVGYSNLAGDAAAHPFLWDRGVMKDLGTLGGTFGFANWINDAGEITGAATIPGEKLHAFSWKKGIMTDLGTLPGDVVSQPQAVNSRGQIVGASSQTPDFTAKRAFLWERGGPMLDLNALVISNSGVQLVNAFDINSRGEISAIGVLPNGDSHAIMLMPCDEDHPDVEGCD